MRVLCALLLLSFVCGVLGQTQTFAVTAGDGSDWTVDGAKDPALTFVAGNVYVFNITFNNAGMGHPFALSSDGTTANGATITAIDAGFVVTQTGCTPAGTNNVGWSANGAPTTNCSIWVNVTQAAVGKALFYRCTVHTNMVGTITVNAASGGATTPPPSGTTPPPSGTTAPPTGPTMGGTITAQAFRIVGVYNGNQGFIFQDSNNNKWINPSLVVQPGQSWTVSLEYGPAVHPFGISTSNAAGVQANKQFFSDDYNGNTTPSSTNTAICATPDANAHTFNPASTTPCVLTIPVPSSAAGQTVYYRCSIHDAMKGQITVSGKNSASTISAGIAIGVATIAAIFFN